MIGRGPFRVLTSTLALSLVAGMLGVVAVAGSAEAAPSYGGAPSVQVGYTDSANPGQAYDAGEAELPLGTWPDGDGTPHTSRVYATFDLSGFEGKKVYGGALRFREDTVADCSKRAIEIWRTRPIEATPSWRQAPTPLVKVSEIHTTDYCPGGTVSFDVDSALLDAVQKRQRRISFEVRVPEQYESDPSYARRLSWYRTVQLNVEYNSVPTVDSSSLYNGGFPCSTLKPYPRIGDFANLLQARGFDADHDDERNLRTTAAIWPAGRPEARTEYVGEDGVSGRANGVVLPEGALVDGTSYVWQARVGDGADVSGWSKKCYFTYDRTRPAGPPTVGSSNYPSHQGGQQVPPGELGVFTFSSNGDRDVAGFHYSWNGLDIDGCEWSGDVGQLVCQPVFDRPGAVKANRPGGSATVTLNPPNSGPQRLTVSSIDSAGNASPTVVYEVYVPESRPGLTQLTGQPEWNQEVRLQVSPAPGVQVTEYEYILDGDRPETVRAEADGTALISFWARSPRCHNLRVRSHSDNGFVSDWAQWSCTFDPWPGIRSELYPRVSGDEPGSGGVGVPGDFTFSPEPGWTDTVAYRYWFINEGDWAEVAPGAGGLATVTFTPTRSGWHDLVMYAVRADGSESTTWNVYSFSVAEAG
ncbi:hypothetical protein [Plantactinospora sonchi]|uniref:DNRLRE domain-containing protein n=1 Tax=Plantactinospora sonchi TaxID=1544735 RepID=A0ABU7S239_9ACTN